MGAQTIFSTSGRLEEKVTHRAGTKQREAATRRAIARARHGSIQQFGRWDSLLARVGLPMAELYADAGIGKAAGTTSFVPYSNFVRVLRSAEQRYGPAFTTDLAEEPAVIERILTHLGREVLPIEPAHPSRAPPGSDRLI